MGGDSLPAKRNWREKEGIGNVVGGGGSKWKKEVDMGKLDSFFLDLPGLEILFFP